MEREIEILKAGMGTVMAEIVAVAETKERIYFDPVLIMFMFYFVLYYLGTG